MIGLIILHSVLTALHGTQCLRPSLQASYCAWLTQTYQPTSQQKLGKTHSAVRLELSSICQLWEGRPLTHTHCLQRSGVPVTPETVPERTNEHTREYASTIVQLGQELQLPVLDLWTLMQQYPGWQEELLCDGLHFTSEGNRFVYKHLQKLINKAFPELRYLQAELLVSVL